MKKKHISFQCCEHDFVLSTCLTVRKSTLAHNAQLYTYTSIVDFMPRECNVLQDKWAHTTRRFSFKLLNRILRYPSNNVCFIVELIIELIP